MNKSPYISPSHQTCRHKSLEKEVSLCNKTQKEYKMSGEGSCPVSHHMSMSTSGLKIKSSRIPISLRDRRWRSPFADRQSCSATPSPSDLAAAECFPGSSCRCRLQKTQPPTGLRRNVNWPRRTVVPSAPAAGGSTTGARNLDPNVVVRRPSAVSTLRCRETVLSQGTICLGGGNDCGTVSEGCTWDSQVVDPQGVVPCAHRRQLVSSRIGQWCSPETGRVPSSPLSRRHRKLVSGTRCEASLGTVAGIAQAQVRDRSLATCHFDRTNWISNSIQMPTSPTRPCPAKVDKR